MSQKCGFVKVGERFYPYWRKPDEFEVEKKIAEWKRDLGGRRAARVEKGSE